MYSHLETARYPVVEMPPKLELSKDQRKQSLFQEVGVSVAWNDLRQADNGLFTSTLKLFYQNKVAMAVT
jgi:hypothetical protein